VAADFQMVNERIGLVIERDDATEGVSPVCPGEKRTDCFTHPAQFKRIYKIDMGQVDADGFVKKVAYIDLTRIANPNGKAHLGENGPVFALPHLGPEGLAVVDAEHIAVVNDNNFPYSSGRTIGQHVGLSFYTLGQRQGLGIGGIKAKGAQKGAGEHTPWFVARKDIEKNTLWVVQGHDHPWLLSEGLLADDASWCAGVPPAPGQYAAKTRYRQTDAPCLLELGADFVRLGKAALRVVQRLCAHFTHMIDPHQAGAMAALGVAHFRIGDVLGRRGTRGRGHASDHAQCLVGARDKTIQWGVLVSHNRLENKGAHIIRRCR